MTRHPKSGRLGNGGAAHADGVSEAVRWLRAHGPRQIKPKRKECWLSALSKPLGVSRQATFKWTRVPAERVLEIAQITGRSRHFLRPDLYPRRGAGKVPAE